MNTKLRFGRRVPLPSTAQITHDLKLFCAQEDARKAHAIADGLPENSTWEDIGLFRAQRERAAETVKQQ